MLKKMNYILLILFLFLTSCSYAVDEINEKIETKSKNISILKSDSVEINHIIIPETLNFNFSKDSLIIPTIENCQTRVVMIREKSKFDFLKYVLPILTLLLGILIKELIDKWTNRQTIKKSGKRWVAEILSLTQPINNQIKSISNFKDKHTYESYGIPVLDIYPSLDCEVFKSLDKNDLIRYIGIRNHKMDFTDIIRISNKTHGYISVLSYLHEILKSKFQIFLDGASEHINSLTQNLQALLMAFIDYGLKLERELEEDPQNDTRYKPMHELFSKHIMSKMEKGDYNPFELRDLFFIPLMKLLTQARLDDRTRPLSLIVSRCFNDIKGIHMENKYISDSISNIKKEYEKQLKDLVDIVNDIDKEKH
jgi:hypothetical protein